ncbi:hypothetical protein BGZ63DRAFT_267929 [Mariannaea sp. PMI_226]|nr:hypothetical protein BGZ63DRAFT_267929 [Mariannaea sp. PMI_226]
MTRYPPLQAEEPLHIFHTYPEADDEMPWDTACFISELVCLAANAPCCCCHSFILFFPLCLHDQPMQVLDEVLYTRPLLHIFIHVDCHSKQESRLLVCREDHGWHWCPDLAPPSTQAVCVHLLSVRVLKRARRSAFNKSRKRGNLDIQGFWDVPFFETPRHNNLGSYLGLDCRRTFSIVTHTLS